MGLIHEKFTKAHTFTDDISVANSDQFSDSVGHHLCSIYDTLKLPNKQP